MDFYCADKAIAIELDGFSHDGRKAYDEARMRDLAARGIRVIRFTNDHVLENCEEVMSIIAKECGLNWDGSPSPQPSPRKAGERG